MTIEAPFTAPSSPSKANRVTRRVTTLIANRPTASAAIGNQRCCLIFPSQDLPGGAQPPQTNRGSGS